MKSNLSKRQERSSFFQLRKFCFLLTVFAAAYNPVKAQVANYTFAYSAGTYTAITGTTVVSGTWDDANSTLITLPFTFIYNSTAYTSVAVNTNGFIVIGAVNSSIYDVCGFQGSDLNAIAGYGTDLINGSGTSIVQYTTRGTSPNRQFVAQWTNCRHYGSTNNDSWSFQIILKETSNAIQVVWGTSTDVTTMGTNGCTDASTESGNVGLLGSTLADFNIRSVTNGTNTWATSTAGVALTDVCNISPTNIPASGLTYTWTPPVPIAMTYDSSTTIFLGNMQTDPPSSTANRILQVTVQAHGTLSPLSATALHLSTTGCTNAGNDIANAKVYYTGSSGVFSNTTQFGSTVTNPNGAYTVTGSATLATGTNYFWITYDIKSGATMGDTLRGCCTQITGSGTMGTQVPIITCPPQAEYQTVNPQTGFVALANLAPDTNGGVMILLTDGTVLCKTANGTDTYGNIWDKLTPDASGSYINGTWSQVAPMHDTRLYFSTEVLKDGRMYVAGGEYGSGTANSEVYDPLTDTWTSCPSTGHSFVDANSETLPNGDVLQACEWDSTTFIYDPITNTYSGQQSTLGNIDESMWVKFPDSSILFVNTGSQNAERYIPSLNQWIADATLPVVLYNGISETGPGFLLPDGRAFFLGATSHTAYYTPSGNQSPGAWAAGPDIPGGNGCVDAAGAMMVNGRILFAANPSGGFTPPASFFEFDYLTNTFTQVNAPGGGMTVNEPCYDTNMLDLPDGTVLFSQQQESWSSQYYVYIPTGTPLAAGKPTIGKVIQTDCNTFQLTGTLFNGICEGAAYGDDWQMTTNRPIIRLTHGSNVYYARTTNWNRSGVATGNLPDTTDFSLPAGLPHTAYQLVVTANGNPSSSVLFVPFPIFSTTLTPPALCSGSTFTYSPATYDTTTTYAWTRAAVTGISNAAITIPQTTNPNEVLVNTTTSPHTVIYQYILTDHGCTDTVPITVVVNPLPTVSYSGLPDTACTISGNHPLTGAPSGGTFIGNGIAGTVFNPSSLSQGNDTITYSFTDANGCINTAKHIAYVEICSGIAEIGNNNANMIIYPNPATGTATISFYSKGEANYTIALYDLPGRKIAEEAGKAIVGNNKREVSLNNIAKGIYFVELRTSDSINKVKLVVQ